MIASALRRFEKLKPAYAAKVQANRQWKAVHQQDSLALGANEERRLWYEAAYGQEQQLRQDSNAKLAISQGKARRRGWLVALELVGLALAGYVIVTK